MARIYRPTGAPVGNPLAQNTQGAASNGAPLPASYVGNLTTEQVIANPVNVAVPLLVAIPSKSGTEGKPFTVSASGYINAAVAENVTVNLYAGSSLVPGNNTLLKSSGAQAYAAAAENPFYLKAKLIWDSVTGKLTGTVKFFINGVLVAEAAVANTVGGLSNVNNPVVQFALSVTFSVANAANQLTVNDFSVIA